MRYYFHIRQGGELIEDQDGDDLVSLEEARSEALLSARHVMAERLRRGFPLGTDRFEIHDANGNLLSIVTFEEAIPIE